MFTCACSGPRLCLFPGAGHPVGCLHWALLTREWDLLRPFCASRWGPSHRPGQGHAKNSEALRLNARLQRGAEGCGGWGLVGRGWSERRDGRGGAHSGTLQPGLQGEPRPLLRARYLVPNQEASQAPSWSPRFCLWKRAGWGRTRPSPSQAMRGEVLRSGAEQPGPGDKALPSGAGGGQSSPFEQGLGP